MRLSRQEIKRIGANGRPAKRISKACMLLCVYKLVVVYKPGASQRALVES